jgi:hypothetical protein
MNISNTIIVTDENKENAQGVITALRDIDDLTSLTAETLFNVELTDGTDTYWGSNGSLMGKDITALINSGYVYYAHFPQNLEVAMDFNGLTRV